MGTEETKLRMGCGRKDTHEYVHYYKQNVDSVETFHTTCQPNQLCDDCQMIVNIIELVRAYCNSTKQEIITYPELIKLVSSL